LEKYAIIVAGGSGKRMGKGIPKQFIEISGLPILMHTIGKFYDFDNTISIVVVLSKNEFEYWAKLCVKFNFLIKHTLIEGGITRFQSVKNALQIIDNEGIVAIHDGVRPFVSDFTIKESFAIAGEKGNAVAAVKVKDSVRIVDGNNESKVLNRSKLVLIQTPQTFQISLIKKAFEIPENESYTDDATVLEALGETINLIDGSYQNIKITTPEDLLIANAFLKNG